MFESERQPLLLPLHQPTVMIKPPHTWGAQRRVIAPTRARGSPRSPHWPPGLVPRRPAADRACLLIEESTPHSRKSRLQKAMAPLRRYPTEPKYQAQNALGQLPSGPMRHVSQANASITHSSRGKGNAPPTTSKTMASTGSFSLKSLAVSNFMPLQRLHKSWLHHENYQIKSGIIILIHLLQWRLFSSFFLNKVQYRSRPTSLYSLLMVCRIS